MLTGKLAFALVCALPLSLAAASDPKPVATLAMPCESYTQIISPAGNQIAVVCQDQTFHIFDIPSGAEKRSSDPGSVNGFEFSRDGRWFALSRTDGTVEIRSTSGSRPAKTFHVQPPARILDFADLGSVVIRLVDAPGQIWDVRDTPKQIATLQNDFSHLTDAAFSPDGKLLVTADGDTVIRYYDTSNWKLVHEYRGLLLETFTIAFTTDGKHVLVGGAEDHITELDLSGTEERRIQKDDGVVYAISPFGNSGDAVIRYFDGEGRAPAHASFWNLATGKSSAFNGALPTGAGRVNEQTWFATREDKSLVISRYE